MFSWIFERAWMLKNHKRLWMVSSAPARPPELTIEVTNICNANCVFCGYQFQERVKGVMPFELLKMIVDQYVALGGGMIEFTPVVGDALVDKNLEQKIRYARSHSQIHRASFITNAILLTRERFEALAEAGATHIGISISGINRAEYERVYRVARFETVIHNLTAIAASPAFAKVKFTIGIRSDRPMKWRKDVVLQQLRSLGYTNVANTSWFDSWSGRIRNEDLPGGMFVRPSRRKTSPCWQLYNSTTVLADGRMTACGCRDLNGDSELALGNIREQMLDAPWKDGRMEALRQRFRDGNPPDICRDCQHYSPVRENLATGKN